MQTSLLSLHIARLCHPLNGVSINYWTTLSHTLTTLLVPVFDLRPWFEGKHKGKPFNPGEALMQATMSFMEVPDDAVVGVLHSVNSYIKDKTAETKTPTINFNIYAVLYLMSPPFD